MAEYRLSPATEHDLENIWLYTCRQWAMQQADRYIDMLTAAFGGLASSPMIA
jgi:toxin ParE1/3/4